MLVRTNAGRRHLERGNAGKIESFRQEVKDIFSPSLIKPICPLLSNPPIPSPLSLSRPKNRRESFRTIQLFGRRKWGRCTFQAFRRKNSQLRTDCISLSLSLANLATIVNTKFSGIISLPSPPLATDTINLRTKEAQREVLERAPLRPVHIPRAKIRVSTKNSRSNETILRERDCRRVMVYIYIYVHTC